MMEVTKEIRSLRAAAPPRPGLEPPGYEDEVPPGLSTGRGRNSSTTAIMAGITGKGR
jgi:hypothetical protein